jgi:hypothetical protein
LGAIVVIAAAVTARPSFAYDLDSEHRFDVRLRAYSQLGILTDSSESPSSGDVARALRFVPADSPAAPRADRVDHAADV